MRSCNNCGVNRCNIFDNKKNPVAICKKYTPYVPPKVKLPAQVSRITFDNPSPEILRYFKRWM